MSAVAEPLERLLSAPEARVEDVLDAFDSLIEHADVDRDGAMLAGLPRRLEEVAADRGGEWSPLLVAAARLRALLTARGVVVSSATPAAAPVAAEAAPAPAPDAEGELAYAGWWRRAAALVLDLTVLSLLYGALAWLGVDGLLLLLLPLAYFAGTPAVAGGITPAKSWLGIEIRAADGAPVGFGRMLARTLSTWLLWATVIGGFVDALMAASDSRRQSLHDKIAGTIVVRNERPVNRRVRFGIGASVVVVGVAAVTYYAIPRDSSAPTTARLPPAPRTASPEPVAGTLCRQPGIRYAGTTAQGAEVCFTLTPDGSELVETGFSFVGASGCPDGAEGTVHSGYPGTVDPSGHFEIPEGLTGRIQGVRALGVLEDSDICPGKKFEWSARRAP